MKEDDVLSHHTDAARFAAVPQAAMSPVPTDLTPQDLLARVQASLEDDKAEDVIAIDLRGKSQMADYMVICSGRYSRQVAAISTKLAERLKTEHGIISKIEGQDQGDWVLIDAGDVIVHVFRPEVREFYQIEKMWMSGAEGRSPDH